MTAVNEYRGVAFAIANNDDGVWRWIIYPKKSRRTDVRTVAPRPTYGTRDAAVQAAKAAIDALLDRSPPRKSASSLAGDETGDPGAQ